MTKNLLVQKADGKVVCAPDAAFAVGKHYGQRTSSPVPNHRAREGIEERWGQSVWEGRGDKGGSGREDSRVAAKKSKRVSEEERPSRGSKEPARGGPLSGRVLRMVAGLQAPAAAYRQSKRLVMTFPR